MRLRNGDKEIIFRKRIRVRNRDGAYKGRIHFVFMRLKTNFKADIRFVEKSGHYTKNGVSIYLEDCTRLPNILKKLANIINDYLEDFDENRGALDRDISNKKLFKSLGLEQEEEEENES